MILKKGRGQHTKYLPYAFTRNGIGMLSSVLRSETAVGVNILIMRAFTAIPQIMNQNVQMVQRIFNIEQHQMETDGKIDLILDKMEEIAPKQLPEQIFRTGCVWDAWTMTCAMPGCGSSTPGDPHPFCAVPPLSRVGKRPATCRIYPPE